MPVFPYQVEGVNFICDRRYALVADEQGLGKTLQAIRACQIKNDKRILWIAPLSTLPQTKGQFETWWPSAPSPTILSSFEIARDMPERKNVTAIMNYDRLSRGDDWARVLSSGPQWDCIVADEAHALKSDSQRTRNFYERLFRHAKRVVFLTGTPAPNNYAELYYAVRHMNPEALIDHNGHMMTRMRWEDQFCNIEMRHVGRGRPVRTITGSKNGARLKEILEPFMIRRKKADVLTQLPPKRIEILPVHPSPAALKDLEEFRDVVPEDVTDEDLLRHLQSDAVHFARLRQAIGLAKAGAIVPWVQDFLADNKERIVLWAWHQSVIDHLVSRLADLGAVKIDGRDGMHDRQKAVVDFLYGDARVLVGQISACGAGVHLLSDKVKPSVCVFVEAAYSPGANAQAIDRIHRISQINPVIAYMTVAERVPLDWRVQRILATKTAQIEEAI